jgi:hypothetical protein
MFRPAKMRSLGVGLGVALIGGSIGGAHGATAGRYGATARASAPADATAQKIGLDGYAYGIALMEFVRQAKQQTSVTVPNSLSDAPLNQLGSARSLGNARNQVIVQPNNDTLYTMGHIDLSRGPLVLHVPVVPNRRYYSFEFMDPYTNVFAYVGTRTTGNRGGDYVVTGPRFAGSLPLGLRRIRSPYERAWLVGRTLVYGAKDLPAVHRIQDGYRLIPLADYLKFGSSWRPSRPRRIVTRHTVAKLPTGIAFFDQLGQALAQNPPPGRDAAILRELRTAGIGPGLEPSREHLGAGVLAGLASAADGGLGAIAGDRLALAANSVVAHGGWFVPPADTGDYGTNYRWRAVVAVNGLAANRPAEAMYIVGAADPTHTLLNGAHDYRIHFARGQLPPARYFWSLTVYNQQFFLVANPLNRYELASHTAGLEYNNDGSLDIYLQHARPAGHQSNWLPTPASGGFEATLRLYGPRRSALRDTYVYPPITRSG